MSINNQKKKGIEWCDYTWNPIQIKCRHDCEYCYMKPIYKRFPAVWKDEPIEYFEEKIYDDVFKLIKLRPSRIFVGSSTDLFGDWIPDSIIQTILNVIKKQAELEKHKFLFLTKNPKRYSNFKFSDNCWCGISIDTNNRFNIYNNYRSEIQNEGALFEKINNLFFSFEPLLELMKTHIVEGVKWVIIGADSRKKVNIPEKNSFFEIIDTVKHGWEIPVFVKNNVPYPELQRYKEFPDGLL